MHATGRFKRVGLFLQGQRILLDQLCMIFWSLVKIGRSFKMEEDVLRMTIDVMVKHHKLSSIFFSRGIRLLRLDMFGIC